jgi:Domain of unknown function (DUF4290)
MEYNSTREHLIIPEYGRNVQKLIQYMMTLEDRDKRNNMAHLIVYIMSQMNTTIREVGDYKRKMWDHMFIISDFKLDVDSPYPVPSREALAEKPVRLPYREGSIRYPHYGKNMEKIIEKAMEYEEGNEKVALTKTIANHMKKSYLNWNRDSVNDKLIIEHLATLSKGGLMLQEDFEFNTTSDILAKTRKKKFVPRKDNQSNGPYKRNDNQRRKSNYHSGQ